MTLITFRQLYSRRYCRFFLTLWPLISQTAEQRPSKVHRVRKKGATFIFCHNFAKS